MSDVILRPWKREDAQQLAAIANNRKVWLNVRDMFPHPYTVMDAMQWIHLHADENLFSISASSTKRRLQEALESY